MKQRWHIVTGEYPPQPGGVSDYTSILAERLADAGDEVHVWVPKVSGRIAASKVIVHELPGHFGLRALWRLDRALKLDKSSFRFFVQYVPHMYGFKAMNIFLAMWLKSQRRLKPWIMFHEVAFGLKPGQKLRHRLLALVQRAMARKVVSGMHRGFISTAAWGSFLQEIAPGSPRCEWLPVPSNIEPGIDDGRTAQVRARYAHSESQRLVAHFGTYGEAVAAEVARIFVRLLKGEPRFNALLLGKGSEAFVLKLDALHPELRGRIGAAGYLPPDQLAAHLRAADVLFQPYEDGINTRRGSAMAGLALGLPIVTHAGTATEPVWFKERLVIMADADNDDDILRTLKHWAEHSPERDALRARAKSGYDALFSWPRTVERLRERAAEET